MCLAAVFILGIQLFLVGVLQMAEDLKPSMLEQTAEDGDMAALSGKVYRREERPDYQIFYLTDVQIRLGEQFIKESKILVYFKQNETHQSKNQNSEMISVGNRVYLTGNLSFFEPASNPGNFDQKFYYQKQGIHAAIWSEAVKVTDRTVWKIREGMTGLRIRWKELLTDVLGEYYGNSMSAVLIGDKSELNEEVKELYQKSGIGHILAISGLHLSFIGIGIYKLLRRITGSYPVGGAFGILFLGLYILMIGLTVSAVRAVVMFLFRVGADMAGRHYDAPTALSVAAVVVLLWRPLNMYDGGFWLSFGAVFAVLAMVPALQDIFQTYPAASRRSGRNMNTQSFQKQSADNIALAVCLKEIWSYVGQGIIGGLTASIGINLVILPILLYYFFEFPLYSLFLNLFVIPMMSVLLFMGMAGSLFSVGFPPLSGICFWICGGILRLYEVSCNFVLDLPGARYVAGRPKVWQIIVYYGILIIVLLLLEKKEKFMEYVDDVKNTESKKYKKKFALILGIAGIIILTNRWGERGRLTTVVLDVGQGDSIFMRGPEGNTYLVDGGSSDVKKAGRYRIEPFLKSQGVGVLDYVLISHGDSDHMNGVEELIERQDIGAKIGTLVLPAQEVWDEALEKLAKKAEIYGIRVAVIKPGQNIKEGDMAITCIQPGNPGTKTENQESEEGDAEGRYEPGNAASMVLAVKFGRFDMLLTGDVEGEGEERLTDQLAEKYSDCTWEVLKVAHHGSKNSSSEGFLRQMQPAYALISAGRENRYGHPHQETIERLTDAGSKIYSTQENGAIIVEVEDGETMKVGRVK